MFVSEGGAGVLHWLTGSRRSRVNKGAICVVGPVLKEEARVLEGWEPPGKTETRQDESNFSSLVTLPKPAVFDYFQHLLAAY